MERYRVVKSSADGLNLDVVEVIPEGKVRGIVQIVHGMQEHKERYLDFMKFLAAHGFACVAADHRGHGKSVRKEEDRGYFYDKNGEAIAEDLNDVSARLRYEYPHAPLIVFGHSMGTLVSRKYLKNHDDRLAGLVLSGAVSKNPSAPAGLALVKAAERVKGDRHVSKTISSLAEGGFDKGVPGEGKNRWLSVNEDNVKAFNEDPACGFPFTLNGYRNLFSMMNDVYSEKDWHVHNKNLPILFVGGKDDPVIGSPKKFEQQMQFLRDRGYQNVSGHLYENMRHEILNESNRQQVYDDVLKFLEEIVKK